MPIAIKKSNTKKSPASAKKVEVKKPAAKAAPKAEANKTEVKKPAPKKVDLKKVKLPENYKPSEKEEYMCPEQLEYFRRKLVIWQDELSVELNETMQNLKEENWQESDITDRATVEIDAGLELRTRDRYRKLINKIHDALIRIEKGTYGYCEESGDEIGLKRLEARPVATLSVEAQERHERDERTHYDEDMEERQ